MKYLPQSDPAALWSRHLRVALLVASMGLTGCVIFEDPDDVVQMDAGGGDAAPMSTPDVADETDVGPPVDTSDDAGDLGAPDALPHDMPANPDAPEDMPAEVDMGRPDCAAQVAVANLQSEWATPNNVYWSWDWVNSEVSVREFEMVVGRTAVDVQDEVNVRVYTAEDNGEFRRTTGDFKVDWTVTTEHEPGREYFAKLIAYDQDWCHAETAVASATTQPDVSNEHVIFSESPTSGFSEPDGVLFSNRHPYEGDFHYEWEATCGNQDTCFDIVRRGGFAQTISNWDPNAFDDAFIEYAFHNEGRSFAQWPAVRIAFVNPDTGDTEWYKAERKAETGPSADYRLHQVPLRFMWREGDRADLTSEVLNWELREFGVGVNSDDGTYVSWDEVRIRW